MSQVHQCKDNADVSSLYPSRGLYLKPIARLNVSVHYPELKQSLSSGGGKSISSWDIMERIKSLVAPDTFIFLRVVKNTLEFVRFEGDLESRDVLKKILTRLDGKTMKVTGFKEPLKIKAAESKLPFPSKYDWDSYFRDAKNMNEMKAGERPDTVHFQNLPSKWFSEDWANRSKKDGILDPDKEKPLPSEKMFKRIWSVFGEVRSIDIPVCDPYRSQISTSVRGISTFTFSNDNVFEAYVQYKDYMSFVKAMDALRGCYLFFQESQLGKYYVANIKVDFDKSKHLSDESIKKRKLEIDRLAEKDKVKKTADKLSKIEAKVKEKKLQEKEKKESERNLAKIEYKIAMEERKYLIAKRRLESIRLMDNIFETIKKNITDKALKKRQLREKTKQEMKKLEKMVIEKNMKERNTQEGDKPKKGRKLQSTVKVAVEKDHGKKERERSHSEESEGEGRKHSKSRSRSKSQERHFDHLKSSSSHLPERNHHYNNRYLGDWEVKAKSHLGSEVKVSSNYVPISTYRGRGRGSRGYHRGRGGGHSSSGPLEQFPYKGRIGGMPTFDNGTDGFNNHHYNNHEPNRHRRDDYLDPGQLEEPKNGQVVQHNFNYLDELDKAYAKYFSSITKRHSEK